MRHDRELYLLQVVLVSYLDVEVPGNDGVCHIGHGNIDVLVDAKGRVAYHQRGVHRRLYHHVRGQVLPLVDQFAQF